MNTNKPGFANRTDRTEGWVVGFCIARAIASVALVGVIVACAPAEATRGDDGAASQAAASFEYFPAQYVNQATESTAHIQAF